VKLALVFNPEKPSTLRVIAQLAALVKDGEHSLVLWTPAVTAVRQRPDYAGECDGLAMTEDLSSADVVVTLGGDGTLLHAARLLHETDRPLLGINLGSLGFLTDTPGDQAAEAVGRLLAGRSRIDPRMRLEARLEPKRGEPRILMGLNDAVVHAPTARVLDVSLRVGGAELGRTLADGVIVATPSGSTAYSLSAGGSVISPRLHALAVTPISPHTLSMRPLVVSADEEIEVRVYRAAGGRAQLSVDGQTSLDLEAGDRVVVRRAARDLPLVVTRDRTFYDTLRTKLGWGHRARGA
jgi:NAD+ kinase